MSQTFPALICGTNAADHAALGVTALLIEPSSGISKISDPTERSSAPSSPVLILDQCSSLRSLTGWQTDRLLGDDAVRRA